MTMPINPTYFTLLSALLFSIGMLGIFLNRRSIIIILMSIELLLLSVNIYNKKIILSFYLGYKQIIKRSLFFNTLYLLNLEDLLIMVNNYKG